MAKNTTAAVSLDNIYTLDGKVPLLQSMPFGLQHVLAMFVANIAPIMIVSGTCGLSAQDTASLIQTAMIMAGVGTLVQLFSVWKLGARLPIVMGISLTFVSIFCYVGPQWGYGAVIGAVMVGGIIEGLLGFCAKYWRKIISPIVAACVVTAIGFSLLSVGANSFAGGSGASDFGSWQNWLLGTITLICCIAFNIFAKGNLKPLSVLFGLIVGYLVALAVSLVVPKIFVGIAFDSGGVASGPMTSTFLLPLSIGTCQALGGNLMTDAFGVVALVALTPLIAIQVMGLVYKLKSEKLQKTAVQYAGLTVDSDEIIDLEEEW